MKLIRCLSSIIFLGISPAVFLAQNSAGKDRDCGRLPGLSSAEERSCAGPLAVAAAFRSEGAETDVLRIETDLVIAEFDVWDKRGRRISGLQRDDFRVDEDGVPQNIDVFSFGKGARGIGRSIILIIDYSQSQAPYISTSINAAKVLIDMLEPEDKLALVTDDVQLLENFTSDKARLKDRLESLRAKSLNGKFGRSRQLSALYAAVSELFEATDKRPVVILQTDGDEYGSLASIVSRRRGENCAERSFEYAELRSAIEKAGTTIYSIIPGIRLKDRRDSESFDLVKAELSKLVRQEVMKRGASGPSDVNVSDQFVRRWIKSRLRDTEIIEDLSSITGGITQFLESPDQAAEVYRSILDEMNQRYLIGYYPTNKERDGKKRAINVTFRSGIKYTVKGKSSYLPQDENGSKH